MISDCRRGVCLGYRGAFLAVCRADRVETPRPEKDRLHPWAASYVYIPAMGRRKDGAGYWGHALLALRGG